MLYVQFAKDFLTASASAAAAAITDALGGDASWLPASEEDLKVTLELSVTPELQRALSSDVNVWEWDDELTS